MTNSFKYMRACFRDSRHSEKAIGLYHAILDDIEHQYKMNTTSHAELIDQLIRLAVLTGVRNKSSLEQPTSPEPGATE